MLGLCTRVVKVTIARPNTCHTFPYTGTAAPFMSFASSLQKNRMARAMSSGFGHFAKSEFGMAFLFASVSMMLGSMEFARTHPESGPLQHDNRAGWPTQARFVLSGDVHTSQT